MLTHTLKCYDGRYIEKVIDQLAQSIKGDTIVVTPKVLKIFKSYLYGTKDYRSPVTGSTMHVDQYVGINQIFNFRVDNSLPENQIGLE